MNKLILMIFLLPNLCNAEILAFIGAPISVELLDQSCMDFIEQPTDSEFEFICMDRAFRLKYRVNEVLHGEVPEVIEFIGFYHSWGMPDYTTFEPALIILETYKEDLLLVRIDNLIIKND